MVAETPSSTTPHTAPQTGPSGESPIERAFRVLQTVVAAGESLGVLELSRRSGLPRSTVSRLVATLTHLGMVTRTADGAVVPGTALATLQPAGGGGALLTDRLRPLLAEVVQTFGENAALSVDDGDALRYLTQISADHAVSVPDVSGERHRFHLVAPGLVTMARWEEVRLVDALAEPLEAATSYSVTDQTVLRRRLERIRRQGHCWTEQELDVGVNGLAVPLPGTDGATVTVSVFGPAYRLNPADRPHLAERLVDLVTARAPALLGDPA